MDLSPSDCPTVRKRLEENGYDVSLSTRLKNNVKSSMIRFTGLLFECGLAPQQDQSLTVKLEIDANPPAGFSIHTSTINKYFPYVIHHHDRPTFLAGKLHAILQRRYAKGRDYYDLVFYLNRWLDIQPNFPYLNNALAQTEYEGAEVTLENWRRLVAQKVESLNWKQVIEDLEPFLLRSNDRNLVNKELLLGSLRDTRSRA
ncbi:MAG: nucleotidyl transferase AbiEii/AbiGii toxin family protein [Acidobacteria bacterium]|nr:nucleotidyl transferase AbiEii/AbiGii toxin family protein [Acidobacteriota bacterium]